MITKICTGCHAEKTLDCFDKHPTCKHGVTSRCKDCQREYKKEYDRNNHDKVSASKKKYYTENREKILAKKRAWRANNPGAEKEASRIYYEKNRDRVSASSTASRLGIPTELVISLRENSCAICGVHSCQSGRALCIDHCHETGKIRGTLCGNCNKAIGLLNDSPELLRNAASYLEENQ